MASKLGPKIVTDNLVLALDCADAKSYAGEPANNLNSDTNDYTGTSYSNMGEWTSDPTRLSKSYDSTIKTPIGTGATLIQESGTAGYHHLSRMGGSDTGNYTISFYFKPVTNDISDLRICMLGDGGTYIKFDFTQSTPTVTQGGAALSGKLAMLEALNDGWYFCAGDFNGRSGGWVGSVGYSPQSSYTGTSGNKKAYICGLNYNTLAYAVPSFDRSATDSWVDLSGNSNDGTLTNNGPVTGTSHYRSGDVILPNSARYLEFDGSDDYVTVSVTGTKTVEVWFNPDTTSGTNILYCPHTNGYDNWLSFSTLVGLVATESADTNNFSIYGGSVSAGNWYQAVAIIDGTTATLYVNGSQVGTTTKTFTIGTWSGNATIGRRGALSQSYANAQIGLVRVYDKALSAAEVLQNYNSTKSRFS